LVAAFRATLEEVTAADIIVHVRDISHAASDAQAKDVEQILIDLGVDFENEEGEGASIIEAWNKADLIDPKEPDGPQIPEHIPENTVLISALTGQGVGELVDMIAKNLSKNHTLEEISVPVSDGKRLAWLHENGNVLETEQNGENLAVAVKMSKRNWGRYNAL
jgi:GTP-binding protein HflX